MGSLELAIQCLEGTHQRSAETVEHLREASKGSTKTDHLTSQAPNSEDDQEDDEAVAHKQKPTRRANHATCTDSQDDDLMPSNSASGAASLSAEQAAFEEDNLNDEQKSWLARVKMCNATRTIDFKNSKNALSFVLTDNTKGNGRLIMDSCADTSIAAI